MKLLVKCVAVAMAMVSLSRAAQADSLTVEISINGGAYVTLGTQSGGPGADLTVFNAGNAGGLSWILTGSANPPGAPSPLSPTPYLQSTAFALTYNGVAPLFADVRFFAETFTSPADGTVAVTSTIDTLLSAGATTGTLTASSPELLFTRTVALGNDDPVNGVTVGRTKSGGYTLSSLFHVVFAGGVGTRQASAIIDTKISAVPEASNIASLMMMMMPLGLVYLARKQLS